MKNSKHVTVALAEIESTCWVIIAAVAGALIALVVALGIYLQVDPTTVHDLSDDFAACPVRYRFDRYDDPSACPGLEESEIANAINDPCVVSACAVADLATWWAERCKLVFAGTFVSVCIEQKEFRSGTTYNSKLSECETEHLVRTGECAVLFDDSSPFFDPQTAWETLGFLRGSGQDRKNYRCGYEAFGQLVTNNCKMQGCNDRTYYDAGSRRDLESTNFNAVSTAADILSSTSTVACFTVECPTELPQVEHLAPACTQSGFCQAIAHGSECIAACADGYILDPRTSAVFRCGTNSYPWSAPGDAAGESLLRPAGLLHDGVNVQNL
eukprot:SAG22_NODE_3693_length_1573_cov_5.123474_1_plen_327_part_00